MKWCLYSISFCSGLTLSHSVVTTGGGEVKTAMHTQAQEKPQDLKIDQNKNIAMLFIFTIYCDIINRLRMNDGDRNDTLLGQEDFKSTASFCKKQIRLIFS